ncbi:MAG: sigma-54 dependent transcriptional regulator [Myxococcota bacterium]|nr:sigma-54 dependent transcriptional regulator [Myxococcota bacterium]
MSNAPRPSFFVNAVAKKHRALIVSNDLTELNRLTEIVEKANCDAVKCQSASEAIGRAAASDFQLAIFSEDLESMNGQMLCRYFDEVSPQAEVIMLSSSLDGGGTSSRKPPFTWLKRPFESDAYVENSVRNSLDRYNLRLRNDFLERHVAMSEKFEDLIGRSSAMNQVFDIIESVAPSDASVLIQGESGTGKELIARAIHRRSQRNEGPMIPVHCGAIPEALLESELFGHVKGAFTGANQTRIGHFEAANGGTIFLDEIGEMTSSAQIRLLRVLQEAEITRVGESAPRKVDVRVIAATNVDLLSSVEDGSFRNDLYYRLNVIPLQLPPLRKRKSDIPLLAKHFLAKYSERSSKELHDFESEVMTAFVEYDWPGNVRELENVIEAAVVLAKGSSVKLQDLSTSFREQTGNSVAMSIPPPPPSGHGVDLGLNFADAKKKAVRRFELEYVSGLLRGAGGNISEAARKAGLDRSNFRRVMNKYKKELENYL